jgi:hypothetical protein
MNCPCGRAPACSASLPCGCAPEAVAARAPGAPVPNLRPAPAPEGLLARGAAPAHDEGPGRQDRPRRITGENVLQPSRAAGCAAMHFRTSESWCRDQSRVATATSGPQRLVHHRCDQVTGRGMVCLATDGCV